ncbi:hypothetical protein ASS90_08850 [Staphylococcus saprophyticus]|uniref:hypothetical protein n=1 Tax=Staphylococcus saprophyticus TaxID=29385 RepID=UPI000853A897|nr:hypothetical protein [Staphylococcus saprophyticus]MDW4273862.1 hypothetical protein [Staphylococcus saprophyticus]MDW4363297.1 hypothetical protein [Staphylococcus saprophyticus]OEK42865.1 hypothetical protein ASS90_08850 [Staphylococcus saprophyticus]
MFKKKKEKLVLNVKMQNRDELDELLGTIQKDIAALKNDFDKLNNFKITYDLEQAQTHTSDN